MNFKLAIVTVALLAFACNSQENHNSRDTAAKTPKSPADSLYDVVDKLHVEGMSKTGKVKGALSLVQKKLDSLVKLPANKIDEEYQQSLVDLQEDLNYADYSMDTWMEEFRYRYAIDSPEVRFKYLLSEQEKVTKVRDNILNALQRADSLLKK